MEGYSSFIFGCKYIRQFHDFHGCIILKKYKVTLVGARPMVYQMEDNDNHPLWGPVG